MTVLIKQRKPDPDTLEPAMLSFARSIRKNHPEILKQIAKESERKEGKRNA